MNVFSTHFSSARRHFDLYLKKSRLNQNLFAGWLDYRLLWTIGSGQSSFQFCFDSNYAIAIAILIDWLKNSAPVFQPMRTKTKSNRTMHARFFPRFEQVTGNCYEF